MLAPMAFALLCALFLVNLCWAEDVTVYMNDSRFVTAPSNLWSNPDVYTFPICGYLRFMNGTGQSVSLSFTGAAITVNFFPYVDGSIAQVTLDGKNVTRIDTYNISGIGSSGYACTPLPWTSVVLPQGQHTITITELDPNPAISIGLVAMLSFVYKTAADTSTSTPSPGPSAGVGTTGRKPPKIGIIGGAVAGGVVALLLLVFATLLLYRRRRRPSLAPTFDLIDEDNLDAVSRPGVVSQTGAFGSDITAFQGGALPDMEQHVPTEGAPITSGQTKSGTPSDVISNPQSAAHPSIQQGEQTMSSKVESHVSPSPSSLSQARLPPHIFDAGGHPLASPPTSPRDTPTDGQYSQNQLKLLKKLSDSHTDGSVIAAVAKSMLSRGTAAAEAELEASDLDLLQRLLDSDTDGSVIRGVAESMFRRESGPAGEAELEANGPGDRPLTRSEEDAPPRYDFIGV